MKQDSQITEIISTTFRELPNVLLESYLDFQEAIHQVSKTGEVLRSRPFRRHQLLEPPEPNRITKHYFAVRNEIVGHAIARYEDVKIDMNPDAISMRVEIHPNYRRQGIGTQLFTKLETYGRQLGRTKIKTWIAPINGPAGSAFATKYGFRKVMEEKESRLYHDKINWHYVNQIKQKYAETDHKYRYERIDRNEWADRILTNRQFAEEMADFYNEVGNLMPMEELETNNFVDTAEDLRRNAEFIKQSDSWKSQSYYAFNGDTIIGLSDSYYPNDPPVRDVSTGLTGVRKAYQRQGIASVLKVKILEYYLENFPEFEYIHTENAASNEGMLAINIGLGFVPHVSFESWQRT